MIQKTDKLPIELVNKIKQLQLQANDNIYSLGKLLIDIQTYTNEIERLESMKKEIITVYTTAVDNLNLELEDLQKKYTDGEINLEDGTVTYFEK
jgi:predicted  nucleic acid-binding Zn-ribbon protein